MSHVFLLRSYTESTKSPARSAGFFWPFLVKHKGNPIQNEQNIRREAPDDFGVLFRANTKEILCKMDKTSGAKRRKILGPLRGKYKGNPLQNE